MVGDISENFHCACKGTAYVEASGQKSDLGVPFGDLDFLQDGYIS